MLILGIETSCDETAISLIDADMTPISSDNLRASALPSASIRVLADKTLSQAKLHRQYGGVFPNMAKREHSRNLIPLFKTILSEANFLESAPKQHSNILENVGMLLGREPELEEQFRDFIPTIEKLPVDAIAVTEGPGLEPCLWAGINFAKALSLVWGIPVVPVNHMEGHIFSSLLRRENMTTINYSLLTINFPALALLISGGHTELVLVKDWFQYEIIGQTRDDAVGEAFDKVARLLGLPYPGGPEISRLAEKARVDYSSFPKGGGESSSRRILNPSPHQNEVLPLGKGELRIELPRPMIHSKDFDFSFSGLKTAVLYLLKKLNGHEPSASSVSDSPRQVRVSPRLQSLIAREFEDAVTEVLVSKTRKAIEHYGAKALLIGGGVIANTHIRQTFETLGEELGDIPVHIPEPNLTTDNALMIAVAGLLRLHEERKDEFRAKGNLRLA